MNTVILEYVKNENMKDGIMSAIITFLTMSICFIGANITIVDSWLFKILCFAFGVIFAVCCSLTIVKSINSKKFG